MADVESNNLLYRPELEPEKNWQSDAVIDSTKVPNYPLDKESTPDTTPTKLKEDLIEIKELFEALPDGVQFFEKSIQKIADLVDKTWPDGTIDSEEKETIYDTSQDKIPESFFKKTGITVKNTAATADLPSLFPTSNPVDIDIESPEDLVDLINDTYEQDQVELDKNYIQKLQVIMQQYFQQILTMKYESGVPAVDYLTKDFDGDSVEVPSGQDLEHLRDYICRSQITRKQKTKLFKKTHSTDRTLQHIRSWYVAYKERERYYSEEYKDSSTYAGSHSNALLRESRRMYDDAYDQSLYSMYKYLNSATMLVKDILNMTVKEAQAKTQLLKSGVNIYKTDTSLDTANTPAETTNTSSGADSSTDNNAQSGTTDTDTGNTTVNSSSGSLFQQAQEAVMKSMGGGFGSGLGP